jgi:hypothetical protein
MSMPEIRTHLVLHWTEDSQFDFYDQLKPVSEAVAAITVFFKNQINLL